MTPAPTSGRPTFGLPPAGAVNGAPAALPGLKRRWARVRIPGGVGEVRKLDDSHSWKARRLRAAPYRRYYLELFELVVP